MNARKSVLWLFRVRRTKVEKINVLIFREGEWWVAQCLEYDIAAQARTLNDLLYEFQRMFFGRIKMAETLGIDPFDDIPAAPAEYRKLFESSQTVKVGFKPMDDISKYIPAAHMLPKEAAIYEY